MSDFQKYVHFAVFFRNRHKRVPAADRHCNRWKLPAPPIGRCTPNKEHFFQGLKIVLFGILNEILNKQQLGSFYIRFLKNSQSILRFSIDPLRNINDISEISYVLKMA